MQVAYGLSVRQDPDNFFASGNILNVSNTGMIPSEKSGVLIKYLLIKYLLIKYPKQTRCNLDDLSMC